MIKQVHPAFLVKANKNCQSLSRSGLGVWLFALLVFGCPGLSDLMAQDNNMLEQPANPAFIGAELFSELKENGQATIVLKKYFPLTQSEIPASEIVMIHERETGVLFQRAQLQRAVDTTVYKDSILDCSTMGKRSNGIKAVHYVLDMELMSMPGGYDAVWMHGHLDEMSKGLPEGYQSGLSLAILLPDPMSSLPNSMPETGLLSSHVFCTGKSYEMLLAVEDKDGDEVSCEFSEPFSYLQVPSSEPGPNYTPESGEPQSASSVPNKTLRLRPPFQPLSSLQHGSTYEINPASAALDKKTGILTFSPDRSGSYLIGITLSDTRDGQILSSHQSVFLIEAL